MMECYCCEQEMALARKVKLRTIEHISEAKIALFKTQGFKDSAAYRSYVNNVTFRWAFICESCYKKLDSADGCAKISGRGEFNIVGQSRSGDGLVLRLLQFLPRPHDAEINPGESGGATE